MLQWRWLMVCLCGVLWLSSLAMAADKKPPKPPKPPFTPPALPQGQTVVSETSAEFLKPQGELVAGVKIATAAPTVDFLYYPGQTYEGRPWSVWGDGSAANGKYYSAIGDHLSPKGCAYIYEYDASKKELRTIAETHKALVAAKMLPEGMHYSPAKVHGRVDLGGDGWLYYSTHRGSPGTTTDANGYAGDWIFRTHPATSTTEIVAAQPVAKHCIPNSVVDAQRMIFYGGTAAGKDASDQSVQFFAYDLQQKKLLYSGPDGPARYMFLAQSSGKVYFVPGGEGFSGPLMRYDPAKPAQKPEPVGKEIGLRSATRETPQGMIYTVSKDPEATLWSFNTKTEEVKQLGSARVAQQSYIASLDVDPTGRYLYYNAGAHGGTENEGTPVVQYDLQTGQKKVIAFLHPLLKEKFGYTPIGTFSSAVSETGDKVYITWNGYREGAASKWDVCALTVIHIPASERQP
jgi:hypothetical protein